MSVMLCSGFLFVFPHFDFFWVRLYFFCSVHTYSSLLPLCDSDQPGHMSWQPCPLPFFGAHACVSSRCVSCRSHGVVVFFVVGSSFCNLPSPIAETAASSFFFCLHTKHTVDNSEAHTPRTDANATSEERSWVVRGVHVLSFLWSSP